MAFYDRLVRLYRRHPRFLQVLFLFVVLRAMTGVFAQMGNYEIPGPADIQFYYDFSRLSGGDLFPYLDFWMEYPPIFPWLAAGIYRLSLLIPPLGLPDITWFNVLLRLALTLFEGGALILVYATVGRLWDRDTGLWVSVGYTLLFAPLNVFLNWFDHLPLFFMMLAVYGLVTDRPILTGVGVGLGFGAKLFPIVVLPAAVMVFRERGQLIKLAGSVAATLLVLFVPLLVISPTYTGVFFQTLAGRHSWETVWAIMQGQFGTGFIAPLDVRYDPAAVARAQASSRETIPWLPVTVVFAAVGMWLWLRKIDWKNGRRSAAFVGLTFGMLLLYSKGYSPQWEIYLTGLGLVIMPGWRGLAYGVGWGLLTVLEWPVAIGLFESMEAFLGAVIVGRTILLLAFILDCAARFWREMPAGSALRKWALPAGAAANSLIVLGLMVAAPPRYAEAHLSTMVLRPFIEMEQAPGTDTPIIVTQTHLIEQLRPYLRDQPIRMLPNFDGTLWADPEEWLSTTTRESSAVWLLHDTYTLPQEESMADLRRWLEANGCRASQTWYGSYSVEQYVLAPPGQAISLEAALANGIVLSSATSIPSSIAPGSGFCLELTWQGADNLPADYKVFVHVMGEEGLVAQADGGLEPPSTTWTAETEVTTRYGIILPASASGTYQVQAGLYDPESGERVYYSRSRDSIPLGSMEVR